MCRFCFERLREGATPLKDIPGQRHYVTIPDVPDHVQSWQDFIKWIMENPEILVAIITAILQLLGGLAPPQKPA